MKITIKGSPMELAELLTVLNGGEVAAEKKAGFPPLLTELAEDEKINELAKAIRSTDEENAPQVEAAEQEYVDPIAFERVVCQFADCIRNRPIKNGKIHKYKDVRLSEFVRGGLFLK